MTKLEYILFIISNLFKARKPPAPTDDHPPVEPERLVVTVVRFRDDQIKALERQLAEPYVSPTTTDLMAGYQLGVQAALKKLRDGYQYD